MNLADKLTQERRGRLAAERMLELKKAELFAANRKLGLHAQALSEEIVETRAEVENMRGENQRVKSDLSAANQKIEIAERRLWQSIETIRDGFAFFNSDHQMIIANRAYLAVFDGLEEITTGVNYVTILQALTDEGTVNTGDLSAHAWRQKMIKRVQMPEPEPTVIQLWNGEYIKMIDQRGPDGDIISLGLNITATVKHEAELREARRVAESANRAKSAFLANMSHEIRTPMNGVVGMADILSDTSLTEEQTLYVETIKNSGEALLVIINDVLDYSKIEAKKLELHPEAFNLERSIQEVFMLLQTSARDKGLTLLLDYDLFLPARVVADPGRVRQVITNLMGNAVKFTNDGHVLVRVTGVPDEKNGRVKVQVTIEDTGIGIPADKIDHIFGEFNQVENERNRQFDGTGLGLAISQRLIDMMDGEIWVTSEEGVGSCFGFQIEMETAGQMVVDLPRMPESVRHVMVVDEVDVNRSILQRQVETLGMRVTTCENAQDALASLGPGIDLIIVDHNMSGMNGLEMAQAVRTSGNKVPILLASSNSGHTAKDPASEHVDAILQKPLPRQELCVTLARIAEPAKTAPIVFSHKKASTSATSAKAPRQMRVLAAEDNKTNRLVFSKMVKDFDIEFEFAKNGEEAVSLYQSFQPDLIFMDISMPKMDGKEAAKAIRALEVETGTRVPIVALTAHAMDGDEVEILASGIDEYLTKPLRKDAIRAQISSACPQNARPILPENSDQRAG